LRDIILRTSAHARVCNRREREETYYCFNWFL